MRGDDRAVTVQIGAILLLAILFSALAVYQVNVVPDQNAAVEFTHNQQVHNEMQEFRNAVWNAGMTNSPQATAVTLGTQYPTRIVAVNPSAPVGTIETTGEQTLRIENADVKSGNDELLGNHTTTTIAYEPAYNEYRNAPTTRVEHATVFNDFDDTATPLPGSNQQLVQNGTITIGLLTGTLSETTTGTVSVDTVPLEGQDGTAVLTQDDSPDNISLTLPTSSPVFWNETLDDERDVTATAYDTDRNRLTIELSGEEYELRLSTVGIGDSDATTGFDIPGGSPVDGSENGENGDSGDDDESNGDDDGEDSQPPTEELNAIVEPSTTEAASGERIEFQVEDTTDDQTWIQQPDDLQWEFGDGTTASGWWNDHSYDSSGTYTVTLYATNNNGETTTHEVEITIS